MLPQLLSELPTLLPTLSQAKPTLSLSVQPVQEAAFPLLSFRACHGGIGPCLHKYRVPTLFGCFSKPNREWTNLMFAMWSGLLHLWKLNQGKSVHNKETCCLGKGYISVVSWDQAEL